MTNEKTHSFNEFVQKHGVTKEMSDLIFKLIKDNGVEFEELEMANEKTKTFYDTGKEHGITKEMIDLFLKILDEYCEYIVKTDLWAAAEKLAALRSRRMPKTLL